MPARPICSAIRAGCPVAATPGSVTTQHPARVVRREVVADLVGGAGAELQRGRAVGEDGLVCRRPAASCTPVRAVGDVVRWPRRRSRACRAAVSVSVARLGERHPRGQVGRAADVDDVRLDVADSRQHLGLEDQPDAVVVLDQPSGRAPVKCVEWTSTIRPGSACSPVSSWISRRSASRGCSPWSTAAARQRPAVERRCAGRCRAQQDLVAPADQGVRRDPLASRRGCSTMARS